jgi:hypothetical protein
VLIDAAMNRDEPVTDPLLATLRGRLLAIGLTDWLPVLEVWLARYAGLEKWLSDASDAPLPSVLKLLQRYQQSKSAVTDMEFAADLVTLPFLYWHARWPAWDGGISSWDSMTETLTQFEQRHGLGRWPAVWESDRPMLDPQLVRRYLMEQLRARRKTVSRDALG